MTTPSSETTAAVANPMPPSRTASAILRRMAFLILLSYGAILVLMSALENSLLYFPSKYPEGNWNLPDPTVEDVHLQSKDGTELHGWYFPLPNPRGPVQLAQPH